MKAKDKTEREKKEWMKAKDKTEIKEEKES